MWTNECEAASSRKRKKSFHLRKKGSPWSKQTKKTNRKKPEFLEEVPFFFNFFFLFVMAEIESVCIFYHSIYSIPTVILIMWVISPFGTGQLLDYGLPRPRDRSTDRAISRKYTHYTSCIKQMEHFSFTVKCQFNGFRFNVKSRFESRWSI